MRHLRLFTLSVLSAACFSGAHAAKPVDLQHQSFSSFQSMMENAVVNMKEITRGTDRNETTHIRLKQFFMGYPVWGGEAILHVPVGVDADVLATIKNATMNGLVYEELNADLKESPKGFEKSKMSVMDETIASYQQTSKDLQHIINKKSDLIVYVDSKDKAHWAYFISFDGTLSNGVPVRPTFIIDAKTKTVYHEWNDVKTLDNISAGGFGGNKKMGKMTYDGQAGHLPTLDMQRDAAAQKCYIVNDEVTVKNVYSNAIMSFACRKMDPNRKIYWDGARDAVNGGYSPSNDALFAGHVIKAMYQEWYQIPVLVDANGDPMMLNMLVHLKDDNAYWDGKEMLFGDGIRMFYPLTSLGVGGHEVSHGFTEQHSGLLYYNQSGGLNESFSDMAAQAAEFYATGTNNWQIGSEIMKDDGALRYMDMPSKDCNGGEPGNGCSIDNANQYVDGMDPHYSSGVFNRAFYLLGTATGWNTRKAFDVMVQANRFYWISPTDFQHAACGVVRATKDLQYDIDAVNNALTTVGLDPSQCL